MIIFTNYFHDKYFFQEFQDLTKQRPVQQVIVTGWALGVSMSNLTYIDVFVT